MTTKAIIGSRESQLAVLQSEMVKAYIEQQNPGMEIEILTMKTTGDIKRNALSPVPNPISSIRSVEEG